MSNFTLEIYSTGGCFYKGECEHLIFQSVDGSRGILAGHEPMICALSKGEIRYLADGEWNHVVVTEGFVEVMPETAAEVDEWYRALKVGDVLTFRYVYSTQITITHRITAIQEKETGGFIIELAGDNKSSEDGQLSQVIDTSIPYNTNYVIGKVTGTSYLLGLIMGFLMKPLSIVLIIILPCLAIIFLEVLKIRRMFVLEKHKQEMEKRTELENELAELRRRLEAAEAPSEESTTGAGAQEGEGV